MKGFADPVLLAARRLAHQHDAALRVAVAEDQVSGAELQGAPVEMPEDFLERLEARGLARPLAGKRPRPRRAGERRSPAAAGWAAATRQRRAPNGEGRSAVRAGGAAGVATSAKRLCGASSSAMIDTRLDIKIEDRVKRFAVEGMVRHGSYVGRARGVDNSALIRPQPCVAPGLGQMERFKTFRCGSLRTTANLFICKRITLRNAVACQETR